MGEIEAKRKKKLTKKDFLILGGLILALLGLSYFYGSKALKDLKARKVSVRKQNVSPADIPPETVAKAITTKEEKEKEVNIPAPAPKRVKKAEAEQGRQEEKPETSAESKKRKEEKKKHWNIPKPVSQQGLTRIPDYTTGLPKPSLLRKDFSHP